MGNSAAPAVSQVSTAFTEPAPLNLAGLKKLRESKSSYLSLLPLDLLLNYSSYLQHVLPWSEREILAEAVQRFNATPFSGMRWLQASTSCDSPDAVALFLHTAPGLATACIANYFMVAPTAECEAYVLQEDFSGMELDDAYRWLVKAFNLGWERHFRDREIITAFAVRYWNCNYTGLDEKLTARVIVSMIPHMVAVSDIKHHKHMEPECCSRFLERYEATGVPTAYLEALYDRLVNGPPLFKLAPLGVHYDIPEENVRAR